MLTADELTQMRADAAEALPGTAIIQTQAETSDGGGGVTVAWTAAGTVDCRIAPLTGTEREMGDRISSDADYLITLPHNASVTTNSRIVAGGGTYSVEAIRDRSWNVTTRVEAVMR